jgi:Zn-dependent protease
MLGFGRGETADLLKSTLTVALVFTIAGRPGPDPAYIAVVFGVALSCAGAGFLLHELMHKLLAQRMGYEARYRGGGFPYVSVLFAFAGWILLSPGAVYIDAPGRPISRRANGLISIAGPATNLALALLFFGVSLLGIPLASAAAYAGYDINAWLAVFNTLPAPGFDGSKILSWNRLVYFAFAAAVAAAFLLPRI